MTPYILGGIAVLGLLLFALGAVIVRLSLSPDGAGFGLFFGFVGMIVLAVDVVAFLIWLAVN